MPKFELVSDFEPKGDQPQAIERLTEGLLKGYRYQTLLGVTGSGKTFTMAHIIQNVQRPTLVISHNKTLAAQLYSEFRTFFPKNAVRYFVSYYDYYQPEAYIPQTDTYIEKDARINEEIDKLRLAATSAVLSRKDVIVVASVSCIYGIGSPDEYFQQRVSIRKGDLVSRREIMRGLVNIRYERNDMVLQRGTFRARGDVIDIYPAYEDVAYRVELFDNEVERITMIDPLTGEVLEELDSVDIFPARHFMTSPKRFEQALLDIEAELQERIEYFLSRGKLLEAQRIEQRTRFDLEMLRHTGYCRGIENYSRHFSGRRPDEPPYCLINYFPDDFLVFIDESHVTIPQLRGMYYGDRTRKETLIEYGFRLPSALDNRPLKFEEFEELINQAIFVSATPGRFELERSEQVVEQIIRPTGLVDPKISVHPVEGQIDHLIGKISERVTKGQRVLVTTLTKRMAEDLTEYLAEMGIRAKYLHSEIHTLERADILRELREGKFDVLVGVNLLREGLDLPEVSLVAILDADKQGFLRSETSLIQTAGRAARNVDGEVILYADRITDAMKKAIDETERRRRIQLEYNEKHGITPATIEKAIRDLIDIEREKEVSRAEPKVISEVLREKPDEELYAPLEEMDPEEVKRTIEELEREMREAAERLEFEKAAVIRDQIKELKGRYGL
ncbi:excinuclease ABC subunit UvrB [Candidatus Poribacteria bacterium]|nr:excinuclease ABC subunit UvrB [Candidatus Poribacteria bacterium]